MAWPLWLAQKQQLETKQISLGVGHLCEPGCQHGSNIMKTPGLSSYVFWITRYLLSLVFKSQWPHSHNTGNQNPVHSIPMGFFGSMSESGLSCKLFQPVENNFLKITFPRKWTLLFQVLPGPANPISAAFHNLLKCDPRLPEQTLIYYILAVS